MSKIEQAMSALRSSGNYPAFNNRERRNPLSIIFFVFALVAAFDL